MTWFKWRKRMRSGRLAQRRRRDFLFKLISGAIVLIILIGFSSWILHRPYLQINQIIINSNSVVSDSDIQDVTQEILKGKYFFLFPRISSLIYPVKEVEVAILTSFSQIESVDIVRIDLQTIAIEVNEQKSYALWCTEKLEDMNSDCYFLNKEGLLFSKAPNFTGNVFFRFYGDLDGSSDPIGKYYLKANNEFNKISLLIDSVKKLGMNPAELHLFEDVDMELYMEEGNKILFSRKQSSSVVLDNLKVVLESEMFRGEEERDIEFIDLRFGNKVYFKLK